MRRAGALACAALLVAACGSSGSKTGKSDWERANEGRLQREDDAVSAADLPPYPQAKNLLEFTISAPDGFRFFVDRNSISVREKVVRYTLVARSPSGIDTVNYEGLRCPTNEHRIFAFGRSDGTWSPSLVSWREITPNTTQRWQRVLQRDFFCPNNSPIKDPKEGIVALEQGMNSWLKARDGSQNLGE